MWYEDKITINIDILRKNNQKVQIKSRRGKDNLPPNHLKKNAGNEHFCKLWIYFKFYVSIQSSVFSVICGLVRFGHKKYQVLASNTWFYLHKHSWKTVPTSGIKKKYPVVSHMLKHHLEHCGVLPGRCHMHVISDCVNILYIVRYIYIQF